MLAVDADLFSTKLSPQKVELMEAKVPSGEGERKTIRIPNATLSLLE